jgi:hypothetical protein
MDLQHTPERIDIVYLWVDGADARWRERRRAARLRSDARDAPGLARYADVEGRYRDNGELRFNLRALERFFPGHGHIYLVTDDQRPDWLLAGDGLSVISHRDLMPAAALPVFDSSHIESYLHHIAGLSERFIYLNDDVFFGAEVDPDDWFGADGMAVFADADTDVAPEHASPQAHELTPVNAAVLSRQWLSQRYPHYRHVARGLAHAPRPMRKSVLREIEREAPELFEQARKTVFRSWSAPSIVADLVPRWMLHTGLAALREVVPRYICTGACDAPAQFAALIDEFGTIAFFCINDTSDDAPDGAAPLQCIARTLALLLPDPCRFERAEQSVTSGTGMATAAGAAPNIAHAL